MLHLRCSCVGQRVEVHREIDVWEVESVIPEACEHPGASLAHLLNGGLTHGSDTEHPAFQGILATDHLRRIHLLEARAPTVIQSIGIEDRRDRARSMPIGGKEGEPEIEEQLTDPAGEALASIPTVFETLVDEPVQRGRPPQSQIDGRRPWRLVIPSALNAAGRSR